MHIATRSTAIGAFASRHAAEQAICGLLGQEFGTDQIGMVIPEAVDPAPRSEEAGRTELWAGEMFRSLVGVEIPDGEVQYYEEALQGGGSLVMVRARDRYVEAMDILHRFGGEYMAAF